MHVDVSENEVLGDDGYTTQPSRQCSVAAEPGVVHEARAPGDWQWSKMSMHVGYRHRLPWCSRGVVNSISARSPRLTTLRLPERLGEGRIQRAHVREGRRAHEGRRHQLERDGRACSGQMMHWRPTPRPVRRVAMVARPWCVGGDTCGSESVALSAGGGRAVVVPATLGA